MGQQACSCFVKSTNENIAFFTKTDGVIKVDTFNSQATGDKIEANCKSAISTYDKISSDPFLIRQIIKFQSLVRAKIMISKSPALSRFFNLKREQLRERYKSVYSKETFSANSWKQLLDKSPTPIVGDSQKVTEIITKEFYYSGEVNSLGKRHGKGVLRETGGRKKEGTWVDGKLEGWGRIITSKGELFEGVFKNDLLNGKGKKVNEDKSLYIGDFVEGLKEGEGKEETKEHIYEGTFRLNKKHGKGKIFYKDKKETYTGDFCDNKITGRGFYTFSSGDTFAGSFLDAMKHGSGRYEWINGGYYEGDYVNNLKCGKGVYSWPDGKIFEGGFENDIPHGEGVVTMPNKTKFKVKFVEGKMIEKIKLDKLN